jgi:cation transport regulator
MSENKELTEKTTTAENAAPSPQETTSQATSQNQQILPEEIKGENLPSEAQQVYTAALKAAKSDGISEEGARQIAWNSVREMFEKAQTENGTPRVKLPPNITKLLPLAATNGLHNTKCHKFQAVCHLYKLPFDYQRVVLKRKTPR